nr:hypothetical protein [Clostridiales bacterium]
MAKKKRKVKIVIQWKKFIPAVTLMAAVFFLFIYLISLLFRPKAPKEQEAVEAPKVIEIPDELKT